MKISTICGNVFDALKKLPANYFDAIICDPPYLFEFMGRSFDSAHRRHQSPRLDALTAAVGASDDIRAIAWHADWLELAAPLLRPGGRVAAASGSRVYHQLATAAGMAGLNVDPMFVHIHGEAMAQGLNIGKAIDKSAGAEREVTGRYEYPDGSGDRGVIDCADSASIYGSNRPGGSVDITAPASPLARLFEGYATRLKDCLGPWLMAHRSNVGTWARNAEAEGLAGLNIEAGRVPTTDKLGGGHGTNARAQQHAAGNRRPWETDPNAVAQAQARSRAATAHAEQAGRYPPNASFDDGAAEELGRQSGELKSGSMKPGGPRSGRITYNDPQGDRGSSVEPNGDTGDASRFFHRFRYNPKAARAERMKGAEGFFWRVDRDHPLGFERITQAEYLAMRHLPRCRKAARSAQAIGLEPRDTTWTDNQWRQAKPESSLPLFEAAGLEIADLPEPGCADGCQHRQRYQGNIHPTLKPIELIRYLATLVLPPDTGRPRRVLVPFAGTFSEVIGCALAGFDEVVAIESEPTYCEIGEARAVAWLREEDHREQLALADL